MKTLLDHKVTIIWALAMIPLAWGFRSVVLRLVSRVVNRKVRLLDRGDIKKVLSIPTFLILLLVGWQILEVDTLAASNQVFYLPLFERLYIFGIIWFLIRAVQLSKMVVAARFNKEISDNLQARKVHTQIQFLEKAATVGLMVIGFALVLMTFESVRRIGSSLIASAGLAGIIVGFAAQKTLGAFLSGFQVAFTQPIRLDDVVVIEGEWGRIEEITLTYVVVRIWDKRRLIVPINYFTEKPFQNWTRSESALLGYVFLNFDFSLSVDSIRQEFMNILKSTSLWDGQVAVLQVTDSTEKTMQVRFLMGARNSSESFDLRCYVREKMIDYVRRSQPQVFPQYRVDDLSKLTRSSEVGREIQETFLRPQHP